MKRCAIITGGKYSPLTDIEKCEYVVACDKGYQYCVDNNIIPDLLIGDFDSYDGDLPENVETITLPVEKDDTDTMYAYRKVSEMGFTEIYLYCALGNRLDHTISNIQTAGFGTGNNITTYIIDEDNYIIVFPAGKIELARKEGYSLSVFALGSCKSVSISGTKYEIENVDIDDHFPIGQSNKWASEKAVIEVKKGTTVVVCSKMND